MSTHRAERGRIQLDSGSCSAASRRYNEDTLVCFRSELRLRVLGTVSFGRSFRHPRLFANSILDVRQNKTLTGSIISRLKAV